MDEEGGKVADHVAAGRSAVVVAELCVVVTNVGGNRELQLGNLLSVGVEELLIHFAGHVEDDVLVSGISIVVMTEPVAGLQVEFHIAHPLDAIQLDFRSCEVWTRIRIVDARIEHLQEAPVCRPQFA